MKIERDPSIEKFVLDSIRERWSRKREGIHLSDLLTPRKKYWSEVKPLPPTDNEIQYWLIGRGHEESLHESSGFTHGEEREWNGIKFTPDFFHNFPDESKTRRGNLARNEGEYAEKYSYYLDQLRGYCALTDKRQGWLRVWSLMERHEGEKRTRPELACYRVEFTDQELVETQFKIHFEKKGLMWALKNKNHNYLPQCPAWMCAIIHKKIVKKAWCEDCQKEFVQWKRHLSGKNKGHTIVPPEYEYETEINCKWFDDCKPVLKEQK